MVEKLVGKLNELPTTRLIAFGSLVDEQIGYLSYGTINLEEPDVYVTQKWGRHLGSSLALR
jgi:hypothetical protein